VSGRVDYADQPVNVSVLFYHDEQSEVFVPDGDLCSSEYPPETSDVRLTI
jgi:hypothetical protein